MKKVFSLLISIMLLIGISGCSTKHNTYTKISYSEFTKMKENKESFPLVIGAATCSACASYEVTMEAFIQKYNVQVYFIDIDTLSDEEKESLRVETNYTSTPTTVFYKEGKVTPSYNRMIGAGDLQSVKTIFTQNGYIK